MPNSHGSSAAFFVSVESLEAGLKTLLALSDYGNSIGISNESETAETTTFAKGSKKYIPGLKESSMNYEGPYDDSYINSIMSLYNSEQPCEFFYKPTKLEELYYKGDAILSSFELSSDISDANALSCEFTATGDVLRETDMALAYDGSYSAPEFIDGNILDSFVDGN